MSQGYKRSRPSWPRAISREEPETTMPLKSYSRAWPVIQQRQSCTGNKHEACGTSLVAGHSLFLVGDQAFKQDERLPLVTVVVRGGREGQRHEGPPRNYLAPVGP